jgi:hypothetical protein
MMATILSSAEGAKRTASKSKAAKKVSGNNYSRAEDILDRYAKGKLNSREVQKELKKFGFGANLRGKSNVIPVFPLDGGDGFDVEL